MSSNQIGDEPFILAEHARQVFNSKDQKDPDWSVVLDVPGKVYVEEEICIASKQHDITDIDIGQQNNEALYESEVFFPEEVNVVIEKSLNLYHFIVPSTSWLALFAHSSELKFDSHQAVTVPPDFYVPDAAAAASQTNCHLCQLTSRIRNISTTSTSSREIGDMERAKDRGVETLQMVVGRPFNRHFLHVQSFRFRVMGILELIAMLCDGVGVARLLNAILVLPKFEVAVYWNESRVSYGGGDAYSVGAITVMKAYYKLNLNFICSLLIVLTTQILGYGWARMLRRYLVYSSKMWWPANLAQVSLFRALHEKDSRSKGFTRMQFFLFHGGKFYILYFAWISISNLDILLLGMLGMASQHYGSSDRVRISWP
ncbi:hypothetical protein GIB67_043290 [Kingdonia uniflora]|uniref:Uncharacterized protein n=1 Tax=Kingdonia uniflora TaxID=39325 RepID=A0A7J7N2R0_9MAGN|nr:hypothetical protein GIB67_043290 [Kingdonia uniflora]